MGQERATQQLSAEVARLTEALAAERRATGAEADIEEGRDPLEAARAIRSELVQVHDELLAAERDRDAARALLRRIYDWQGPHGLTVTVMNDIKAHLSGQPAAPACACGHPEDSGKHGASMCEIDEDDQRETAPTPHEAHSCDWFGRFTCRICGKHRDEPASSTRDDGPETVCICGHAGCPRCDAAPPPTADEARERELESEVQRLKERNAQLVVSSQVRSYEAALDAQERAEKALFQLRERVASAVETLQRALEALRGA